MGSMTATQRRIEFVLANLQLNADKVALAHDDLGIPLEDVLASYIRKLLTTRTADANQPDLFDETKGTAPADQEEAS